MPHDPVKAAVTRLVDTGLATRESLHGCTNAEVKRLESQYPFRLPPTYRKFLRAMGHHAGEFLVGSDYAYPKLFEFREAAVQLLSESQAEFVLPSSAFVFLFHQGHSFLFFCADANIDDPEVFLFTESEATPRRVFDSFSGWLHVAIEDDIAAYEELRNH